MTKVGPRGLTTSGVVHVRRIDVTPYGNLVRLTTRYL